MRFYFRGNLIIDFYEMPFGSIKSNTKRFELTFFTDGYLCSFIKEDITLLKQFFIDCELIVNGEKELKDCQDVEVY